MLRLYEPTGGRSCSTGSRHHAPVRRRAAAAAPAHADGLPGSVRVAEPAALGRAHDRRAAARPRHLIAAGGRRRASARSSRSSGCRPTPRTATRTSSPAASASASGSRARSRSTRRSSCATSRCRRSTSRSRRRSSTCSRSSSRSSGSRTSSSRTTSRSCATSQRPDRGDVPRQDRRGRAGRRPLRQPAAPVHADAALGDPDPGSGDRADARRSGSQGDLPSPANPPAACRFHTRCPFVQPTRCRDEEPLLRPRRPPRRVPLRGAGPRREIKPVERAPVFDPSLDEVTVRACRAAADVDRPWSGSPVRGTDPSKARFGRADTQSVDAAERRRSSTGIATTAAASRRLRRAGTRSAGIGHPVHPAARAPRARAGADGARDRGPPARRRRPREPRDRPAALPLRGDGEVPRPPSAGEASSAQQSPRRSRWLPAWAHRLAKRGCGSPHPRSAPPLEGCQAPGRTQGWAWGDYQSRMPPMRKTRNSLRMWVLLVLGTDGTRIVSPERGIRKC